LDFPVGNPSEKLYLDKPHDASGSHHRRDEEIPKTRTIDSFCTSPDAKKKTKAPEAAFLNWTNRRVRRAWLMD